MSLDEMDNNMTVFYYKRDGAIHSACSGVQDASVYFGDRAEDMSSIVDKIILTKDEYVINHIQEFTVNIDLKRIELRQAPISYPVASQ